MPRRKSSSTCWALPSFQFRPRCSSRSDAFALVEILPQHAHKPPPFAAQPFGLQADLHAQAFAHEIPPHVSARWGSTSTRGGSGRGCSGRSSPGRRGRSRGSRGAALRAEEAKLAHDAAELRIGPAADERRGPTTRRPARNRPGSIPRATTSAPRSPGSRPETVTSRLESCSLRELSLLPSK